MKRIGELYIGQRVRVLAPFKVGIAAPSSRFLGEIVGRTSLSEYLSGLEPEVAAEELDRIRSEYGPECSGFLVYHVSITGQDRVVTVEPTACEAVDG